MNTEYELLKEVWENRSNYNPVTDENNIDFNNMISPLCNLIGIENEENPFPGIKLEVAQIAAAKGINKETRYDDVFYKFIEELTKYLIHFAP